MLVSAVEHFFPIGAAGAVITAILMRLADDAVWLLPGLWQILIDKCDGRLKRSRFRPESSGAPAYPTQRFF